MDLEERKAFVYLLARFAAEIEEFSKFAEYVGPQFIKEGSLSELMNNQGRQQKAPVRCLRKFRFGT